MTLILTTGNIWGLHQSSDYRLTDLATRSARTDVAGAKQLSASNTAYTVQIAFTGVAEVGRIKTREWISGIVKKNLTNEGTSADALANAIAESSIEFLKRIRQQKPELTIVLGTVQPNIAPRLFVLSNFEDPERPTTRTPADRLSIYEVSLATPKFLIHGMRRAVSDPDREYLKRISELNQPAREIQDALARINSRAAANSGGWISAECMTASLLADGTRSEFNHGAVAGMPDNFIGGVNISDLVRTRFKAAPGKQITLVQSAGTIGTVGTAVAPPTGPPRQIEYSSPTSSAEVIGSDGRV